MTRRRFDSALQQRPFERGSARVRTRFVKVDNTEFRHPTPVSARECVEILYGRVYYNTVDRHGPGRAYTRTRVSKVHGAPPHVGKHRRLERGRCAKNL